MSWLLQGISSVRTRLAMRQAERIGKDVRTHGRVWIHGGGHLRVGDRVRLDATRGPIELHAAEGAVLVLGDEVVLEGGVSIEAVESIVVEARSAVGAWTKILDNHFHPLAGNRLHLPPSDPVHIGPGVTIGERCVVLPGTRLEAGVRLADGVVIGRRVPRGVALAGSPPRASARGISR
jgi:acetyltransferase-like isoleucine patch superfamily enzyme